MPQKSLHSPATEEAPELESKRYEAIARGEEKPRTLHEATLALAVLHTEIDSRATEIAAEFADDALKAALNRIAALEADLKAAEGKALEFEAKLANAPEALVTMTRERDAALGKVRLAERNMGLLEGLCGVRGIDPAAAVHLEPEMKGRVQVSELEARYAAAKSPQERSAIVAEIEAAKSQGRLAS